MATKKTEETAEEPKAKKPAAAKKAPAKKPVAAKKASSEEAVLESSAVLEGEEVEASKSAKGGSFIPTVGRRKTAIARVRLIKNGRGTITVNGKAYNTYFTTYDLREQVIAPMRTVGQETTIDVSAKVTGGGIRGQAEAVRHGIARALIVLNPTYRSALKKLGYLTRDPRKRERKKPGKLGARRSPQWSKR